MFLQTAAFAYGVVLMELLTGQSPLDDIVESVTRAIEQLDSSGDDAPLLALLDSRPGVGSWDAQKATAMARIAVQLTESRPDRRPTIHDVLAELGGLCGKEVAGFTDPKTNVYTVQRFDPDTGERLDRGPMDVGLFSPPPLLSASPPPA